jgi:tryptophanyl-tRNA synthetase
VTDPARVAKKDPGNPEICNLYALHKYFSSEGTVEEVAAKCRSAGWGCLDCKKVLARNIAEEFAPIRTRAEQLRSDEAQVHAILRAGAERARGLASATMREVLRRMGFLAPDAG